MSKDEQKGSVIPIPIEDEVKNSYLNYAMSVIVSRALPDVRDGLKPVHRRVLYSMGDMSLWHNTAPKKSGRIVGDVLGKYHPHGDQSIYGTLVRLAQDFSQRYPMIQGQGNFGSLDGDPPAAMRYTEARLSKLAEAMLRDLDKETVDFGPNYDDAMTEPLVLPAAFPFLLANGGSGIAVGMATQLPPHNLTEVANAIAAYIDEPDIELDGLLKHIKGPDFPTGGIICGISGIRNAYSTGKGKIVMRARAISEEMENGRSAIVVTEIPYLVNKSVLITRIADLVRAKKIDGISDLRDESDRDGIRIVLELKRGTNQNVLLNQLYTHSQLQENINVNAVMLVNGQPRLLTLKEQIHYFALHRQEVVTRRTQYELRKAEERAHILKGLQIALDNIDEVIAIIRQADTVASAKIKLQASFALDQVQAQAILDLRLQKLTSLETQKITDELNQLLARIDELKQLLSDKKAILTVVKEEMLKLSTDFGDKRRTEIIPSEADLIDIEDLIYQEDMVIIISRNGYLKRTPNSAYRIQGRGGRGSMSAQVSDDDDIQHTIVASTHDYIMFITSLGKAYKLRVHQIPEFSRSARGQHVRNILELAAEEEVTAAVATKDFNNDTHLFMATKGGVVKKVNIRDFANARLRGIKAINLDEHDRLISAIFTNGSQDIVLVTRNGKGLRFNETAVRSTGRASRGVRGIKLSKDDRLISAVSANTEETMLLVSEYGSGKRIEFDELNPHGRGTGGQKVYAFTARKGKLIAALPTHPDDEVMVTSSRGITVKQLASGITIQRREASGVRLIDLTSGDSVVSVSTSRSI